MSKQTNSGGLTYEASGVSIDAQDRAIAGFRAQVEQSHLAAAAQGIGSVLAGVGSFGAAFAPNLSGISEPVFVSSTDGIGTKVRLHARFGSHGWAGEDLVAAVVNDVLCQGARPAFFLDYVACNRVDPQVIEEVVGAMGRLCGQIGCALIGGEIAEMGEVYQRGEYDLAGFCVGIVDRQAMWGADKVREGDVLIGLASSGAHCNGYSLIRRLLEPMSDDQWRAVHPPLEMSLHDALMLPTRCYAAAVSALLTDPQLNSATHAAAHISGGGLIENLPRSIPAGLAPEVSRLKVRELAGNCAALFDIIAGLGQVSENEMWRVFNMGVGFVLVVEPTGAEAILELLGKQGFAAAAIGEVKPARDSGLTWAE